ncbi:COMPASS, Set1C complex protein [Myriangium duriaei CBS 260.36]|uniref:COMPASS, Set1C complex protein n=1 Tax=Myriangium duriaei CBS 260.36 TaxID=1168546 RepID=A0A9P4IQN6_9PEZI|nr:COMPASS, Set1C complex protein [Myriangium duriaei CBS 260.36]
MNLSLVDPFILAQDIPEALIARLRSSGNSVCIRFNHQGDLLASGTSKGGIAIFDLETNGVARKLRGHTPGRQISSLSWSASGRYLLSAAVDWRCILWDLQDGSRLRTINLGAPVFCAELHPDNHLQCIAALYEEQPVMTDMTTNTPKTTPLTSIPKRSSYDEEGHSDKAAAKDAKHFTSTALFHPSGKYIITGTTKGWLNIISTTTAETIYSLRLSPKPIVQLRLSDSGTSLLTNSADTIIRTLRLPDLNSPTFTADTLNLVVEHKFQDVVNRLSWNAIAFSPSSDYVMASTLMNHDIYIWERGHGSLVKILEGPREELGSIDWHPVRPCVAATGVESGRIYLWSVNTPQRWSALAPDFAEVEENVEYVEEEGEFDILEAGEVERRREGGEGEAVDVLTIDIKEKNAKGAKTEAFRMPVLLDIDASDSEDDMVAIGAGQYRRRSHGDIQDADEPGTNGAGVNGKKR